MADIVTILNLLTGNPILFRKTNLAFDGSRSKELSVGPAALTLQGVKIRDASDGETKWFNFFGAGVTIGPESIAAGTSFSEESFSSWGGNVHKGPSRWSRLGLNDLVGVGCIVSFSGAFAGGSGANLLLFNQGEVTGLPEGVMLTVGLIKGIGGGITVYKGVWYEASEE